MHKTIFFYLFGPICLISVCFLWKEPIILTIALTIISLIALLIEGNKKSTILFFICSLWGAFAEIVAIYFGGWHYTISNVFGIPFWLPLLWGDAAIFIYRLRLEIEKI